MDLTGTWRAAVADDDLRRAVAGRRLRRQRLGADRRPRPLAEHPRLRRRRWPAPLPAGLRRRAARARSPRVAHLRRHLLPGGRLARRRLPRRHRGLLRTARLRGDRGAGRSPGAPPRRRGDLRPPGDRTAKRNLTGVFQHWDAIDPAWNPGGIWRPVHVRETGPVRIAALRVSCREATAGRAVVVLRACLDSDAARTVCLQTRLGGQDHQLDHPLATGDNEVEWTLTRGPARAVVAARPGRCRAPRPGRARRARPGRGRDDQRRTPAPHRAAPGATAELGAARERRAPLPQGLEPRPQPRRRWPRSRTKP